MRRTETSTYCNYKGYATYWSLAVDGPAVDDVAWSYEDPMPETTPIKNCFAFDSSRTDVVAELPDF